MAAGPKKHLKRINAPRNWCLDKLGGIYAPKTSSGPHKATESIPLAVLLRNQFKYALNYNEVKLILMQRLIKIDGKVRTDRTFPVGFQDVVTIEKTNEVYRILYDAHGRFVANRISAEESQYKICKVRKVKIGSKHIPYAYLSDGRTVRYANPEIKIGDSVKLDIITGKVDEIYKFEVGAPCCVTGGRNIGRIGVIESIKVVPGKENYVTVRDSQNDLITTIDSNIYIIGNEEGCKISLYKDNGVRKTILDKQAERVKSY